MKTIYKYDLPMWDEATIEISGFERWLHVDVQHGIPSIWAVVNPVNPTAMVPVYVRGTGHPMTGHEGEHIGTLKREGGSLVFHVFAGKPAL